MADYGSAAIAIKCDPDYRSWHGGAVDLSRAFMQGTSTNITGNNMALSGTKHVVVCNGNAAECDTIEQAQAKAEQFAHQYQADAFILKPIRKVAPKRDVVTTDL